MRVLRWSVAIGALLGSAVVDRTNAQTPRSAPPTTRAIGSMNDARTVRGRVLRGARERVTPVAGVWVVLHRVGQDGAAPLDSVRSDGAGRYAFTYRRSGDSTAAYFVSCVFAGVAYFTAPLKERRVTGDDADIVVHDSTSAPIPIQVRGRHFIVAAPDTSGRRPILEVYELSNDTVLTRVAGRAGEAVWQSRLLTNAANFAVGQTDFSTEAVALEQGEVRVTAPFAPGLKQLSYTYDVPVEKEFAWSLDAPADVLEVLIEDAMGRADGGGLRAQGPTVTNGRTFARFVAQDVPAGVVIHISAPGSRAVSQNTLRILIVLTALGAVLLFGLARTAFRRR